MIRQARLGAPGTVYHVMIRGIERDSIFRNDEDRKYLLARVGELLTDKGNLGFHLLFSWATEGTVVNAR